MNEDGSFKLNMKYFSYDYGLTMTNGAFDEFFGGPPRKPESWMNEREFEEFFLTSWAVSDPAIIVDVPANVTDVNGNLIAGPKATKAMWRDVGHHSIVVGPRYREHIKDIFIRGKLADDMSLYVHRPSVTDPSCAPAGDDTFYALSPVPHLGFDNGVDWAEEEPRYRAKMAKMLDERLIPGFRDRITEDVVFTPETFRDRYLSPFGAGFSIEPRILQSAWFRPHNHSEDVRNLYLVGASTHPGAGVPGVLMSARAMADSVPDALPA